jgi:hypothetical protein
MDELFHDSPTFVTWMHNRWPGVRQRWESGKIGLDFQRLDMSRIFTMILLHCEMATSDLTFVSIVFWKETGYGRI